MEFPPFIGHTKVKHLIKLAVLISFLLSGCVSVKLTPPLHGPLNEQAPYGGVAFTSGRFQQSHEVVGVIQMTREGYRSNLAGEINKSGTDPMNIMREIGEYARQNGADGIQNFSLIMQNPTSEEEDDAKRIWTAIRIAVAVLDGDNAEAAKVAGSGETTIYFVKGELVKWTDTQPALDSSNKDEGVMPEAPANNDQKGEDDVE